MSSSPERQAIEQRSALGAALSFEFECSFAAAEANKAAHELLAERHQLRQEAERTRNHYNQTYCPPFEQVQILGDGSSVSKTEVIELEWHPMSAEQPVRLALLEPIRRTEKEVVFRKLLKRHVKTEYEEEKGRPVLAAMFGDVALPLASFARRKDGLCSYVQIGSEIKDDNFHVMASDDKTGRNVVIEAVRDVLDTDYGESLTDPDHRANNTEAKRREALQKLLNIEFQQNTEQLTAAFEAQLVRLATAEVKPDTWRRLMVLGDNGDSYDQKFNLKPVLDKTRFPDQRAVSLAVGRPVEGLNQDVAQLFAVTRGILALPLASLNSSTGQIAFENPVLNKDTKARKQVVYQLLSLLRGEPLVVHDRKKPSDFDHQLVEAGRASQRKRVADKIRPLLEEGGLGRAIEKVRVQHPIGEVDKVISHYFRIYDRYDLNVSPFQEGELPDTFLDDPLKIGDEVRAKVKELLSDPLTGENPYPNSVVLGVALKRLRKENEVRNGIFSQFDVQNRLAKIIGTTTVEEESLVQRLYDMRLDSTVHRGVVRNVGMNNTVADAIFQVQIEREGTTYMVTVSGKPEAMEDEPLKVLPPFCFSFDATRPIHSQLNGTRDHLSELVNTFKALKPVK